MMRTGELLNFAENNGYNSVMFSVKNKDEKQICVGKFLDAYYEFVNVPILENGFTRLSDLEETLGYDISFEVIDEQKYYAGAFLDFIMRGKEVPQEIKDGFSKYCSLDTEE